MAVVNGCGEIGWNGCSEWLWEIGSNGCSEWLWGDWLEWL